MAQASVLVKTRSLIYELQVLERVTSGSPSILSHVLFGIDQKGLRLSTTNMFVGVTSWVTPLSAIGQVNLAVPIRSVQRCLRLLKDDQVLITQDSDSPSICIHGGQGQERIKGTSASDFPPVPVTSDEDLTRYTNWRIWPYEIRTVSGGVATVVATDDSRPVLTSVHLEIEGPNATFVASDGFRMAIYEASLEGPVDRAVSCNIPVQAIQEIARLSNRQVKSLHFRYSPSSGLLFCHVGPIEVTTSPVRGKYPDWRKLIPETYGTRIVLAHSELAKVFTVVNELETEPFVVGLRFDVAYRRAHFVVRGTGLAELQMEVVPIQMSGDDAKTAVSIKFLKDALEAVEAKSGGGIGVMMELNDQETPPSLRPISIVSGNNCRHFIMPMEFKW